MPDTLTTNSPVIAAYRAATPGSAARAAHAAELFPSGITHDSRYIEPYGLYINRAQGPRKWDVDGRCYVDYFGGHGALLLGHCHPEVMAAVHAQLDRGTHYGASHELEIEWAERVKALIPTAERVRFTSSGTEATLMAVRLARAFTGKAKLVRFNNHFHGWHDHMTSGHTNHFDGTPTTGVLDAVAGNVLLCDQNDEAALARLLEQHKDIAAAIIEPTGANGGKLPIAPEFLQALRRLTAEHGVLLIFDEVVNGFRVAPGGAQEAYGIRPDLTTLAKILAGGLPGGAVTGRKDILDLLDFQVTKGAGKEKIAHPGTFNANPLSAAAGIACLRIVRDTDACARANRFGDDLRHRLNEVFEEEHVPWAAYGTFSSLELFTNPERMAITPTRFDPLQYPLAKLKSDRNAATVHKMRLAMMINGVDLSSHPGGVISATHGEAELEDTVNAMRNTVGMLKAEGEL
ncbi:MAG TPA: aminotransferase class III-fold pyridoxal phosphate-dependent enzyme [Stellaceae bacterium]|jgi:glutamate-1-semialdehyde 2,1-aminomutase|nr:aminotransferase class III-fold pyridoxal phosphate-dependent enzyme [Stellaceae bacterium]